MSARGRAVTTEGAGSRVLGRGAQERMRRAAAWEQAGSRCFSDTQSSGMLTLCQVPLHKPAPGTPTREVPFYRQGDGGTGRVSSLPKAAQRGAGIQSHFLAHPRRVTQATSGSRAGGSCPCPCRSTADLSNSTAVLDLRTGPRGAELPAQCGSSLLDPRCKHGSHLGPGSV